MHGFCQRTKKQTNKQTNKKTVRNNNMTGLPIVIRALETVLEGLEERPEEMEMK